MNAMKSFLLENHRIIALIALASSWFLIFPSCQRNIQQDEDSGFRLDTIASPQYAGLFVAGYIHHHRAVWLKDPWDTTKIYSRFIILSHRLPNDSIPHGYQPIILPVNSIATTSSTLISHLSSLNILDHLIGVADTSYIFHPYIRQRIHDRQVQEIARGDRIEAESLIACRPDLSFITLYAGQDYSRFQQMGLQIVPLADYMENHPLGRAEWIRFVGYFVGKEKEADSIFRQIASE
ncbi:MAG TPA: hypothetical protein PK976_06835, partial [Bacteroidales bacterium]|nr:hypothetical protein [Bacteroidales bacterium]